MDQTHYKIKLKVIRVDPALRRIARGELPYRFQDWGAAHAFHRELSAILDNHPEAFKTWIKMMNTIRGESEAIEQATTRKAAVGQKQKRRKRR